MARIQVNIDDGFLNLMTNDGTAKDDVKVPEGDIGNEISAAFDEGKELLVTIVSAMGEEQVSCTRCRVLIIERWLIRSLPSGHLLERGPEGRLISSGKVSTSHPILAPVCASYSFEHEHDYQTAAWTLSAGSLRETCFLDERSADASHSTPAGRSLLTSMSAAVTRSLSHPPPSRLFTTLCIVVYYTLSVLHSLHSVQALYDTLLLFSCNVPSTKLNLQCVSSLPSSRVFFSFLFVNTFTRFTKPISPAKFNQNHLLFIFVAALHSVDSRF